MLALGLNAYHGDASTCLVRDGEILAAAEEEHFRRIKHWAGFPTEAVRYWLEAAGAALSDVFYSHHVIEHLPDGLLEFHFKETYRCLKPGGMFRVGGPNGDMAIRKYIKQDSNWFGDFPDRHESIGSKLVNLIFCRNEHLTLLTPSYIEEICKSAGFERPEFCAPTKTTTNPALVDQHVLDKKRENTPDAPHTLIAEGRKPSFAAGVPTSFIHPGTPSTRPAAHARSTQRRSDEVRR